MIPVNNEILDDYEIENENTLTHRIIIEKDRIAGKIDELEAVQQAVYIMLNVERYQYVIFSPQFGIELVDLIGKPIPFCLSEIKRRVTECLTMDDRIETVQDFEFETNKNTVHCSFTVVSNVGSFKQELGVNI